MTRFPIQFRLTLLAVVLAGSLASSGSVFAENAARRDLSVEQAPIADCGEGANAPTSDIQVSATLNHSDAVYAVGDTVTMQVRASEDAYITVLEVGTSGKVHIIFPNAYQEVNRIRANNVVSIPMDDSKFRIRVSGPAGRDVIKVFATREPLNTFAQQKLVQEGPYFTASENSRTLARDLTVELREKHKSDFGVATQIFAIVDRNGPSGASVHVDQPAPDNRGGGASVHLSPSGAPVVQGGSGGSGGGSTNGGPAGSGGKGGDAILCQGCVVIPK
jgi:hypothetical protein